MPVGPGIYDEECTQARRATNARACLLIVFSGQRGSGFSLQSKDLNVLLDVPKILRHMADEIERSTTSLGGNGGVS